MRAYTGRTITMPSNSENPAINALGPLSALSDAGTLLPPGPAIKTLRRWVAAPTIGLLLFIGVVTSAFLYLQHLEREQQSEALDRYVEWAYQSFKGYWQNQIEVLSVVASEWSRGTFTAEDEPGQQPMRSGTPADFLYRNAETAWVGVIDGSGQLRWRLAQSPFNAQSADAPAVLELDPSSRSAWAEAREHRQPRWSRPYLGPDGAYLIELHLPVRRQGQFAGTLFVAYPLRRLFAIAMTAEAREHFRLELTDVDQRVLASTSKLSGARTDAVRTISLEPNATGLSLRVAALEPVPHRVERILYGAVMALSILILVSLGLLWRTVRQRILAEAQRDHLLGQSLSEAAFRRAMEDSMLTGMRAFDLNGRITYVNRAFCRMTGFDAEELVGTVAPFPYWTDEEQTHQAAALQRMLAGQVPASGIEVRLKRRDGTAIDTRMYVSPLIDHTGAQAGWMTSVTDITEPRRIRAELVSAHERFTTVLDEIDAAVSVLAIEDSDGEALLFANPMYRALFGMDPAGHRMLRPVAGNARSSAGQVESAAEVWSASAQLWFEVRSRPIRWVDGRVVEILVATDVTARRLALERQRQQDERLAHTSRLVTMGEMASSLAHEINQPLAAITNYVSGLTARVRDRALRGQSLDREELIGALAKTERQAERAGEVIRRIRAFVRRSEPAREACEARSIVDDAVGLAEIDARRHRIRVDLELGESLPRIWADPILISQVLLNLMKNAIEAMNSPTADVQPGAERSLRVTARALDHHLEFAVADTGPGLSSALKERLFEPFYTTKSEGMGMGLNICRTIVEFHEGRLWVEPAKPRGCIFRFTLPYAQSYEATEDS